MNRIPAGVRTQKTGHQTSAHSATSTRYRLCRKAANRGRAGNPARGPGFGLHGGIDDRRSDAGDANARRRIEDYRSGLPVKRRSRLRKALLPGHRLRAARLEAYRTRLTDTLGLTCDHDGGQLAVQRAHQRISFRTHDRTGRSHGCGAADQQNGRATNGQVPQPITGKAPLYHRGITQINRHLTYLARGINQRGSAVRK